MEKNEEKNILREFKLFNEYFLLFIIFDRKWDMSNQLYKVDVVVTVYVNAKDVNQANQIALRNAKGEIEHYGIPTASLVKSLADVIAEWKEGIPYSQNNDETKKCRELVADIPIEKQPKKSKAKKRRQRNKQKPMIQEPGSGTSVSENSDPVGDSPSLSMPLLRFKIPSKNN